MNESDTRNPYKPPASIGGIGPASAEANARATASRKSLMIGLATFAIAVATLFISVLFIVLGVNAKLAGQLWMLTAMLVTGTGSLLGFFAAFPERKTKWQLNAVFSFAIIVNSAMMLFAVYCLGCFALVLLYSVG